MIETGLAAKSIALLVAGWMATILPFPSQEFNPTLVPTRVEIHDGFDEGWAHINQNSITTHINVAIDKPENSINHITVYRKGKVKSYSYIRPSISHDYNEYPEHIETDNFREFWSWLTDTERTYIHGAIKGIKERKEEW